MDDKVKKIDTSEKCKIFAKNCIERGREDLSIQAKERAVQLRAEVHGAESGAEKEALVEMGLENYAFEAVIIRHPELFSNEALQISQDRMNEWKNT